jgi:hypothetical protein
MADEPPWEPSRALPPVQTPDSPRRPTPNPARPLLPPEDEAKFVELDARKAEAYTAIEQAAAKLAQALEVAEDGIPRLALDFSDTTITRLENNIPSLQKKDPPG